MKNFLKIGFFSILILLAAQLIPIEKNEKPTNPTLDFISTEKPQKALADVLKKSCYDCHSNHTKYPKYASYAPISWSIASHINDGKKHANFSEWQNYNPEQRKHILENSILLMRNNKMPMTSYVNMHPEAKLKETDLQMFEEFANKLLSELNK